MDEIKYVGQISSSQNSRVIDPNGISYAMTNGEKDGTPKIIEALAVGRERTEEEKRRRRIHGDKGAKFSQGKQICLLGDVSGCLTTMPAKDNLVGEIYNKDVTMTKEPIIIDDYNQRIPENQDVIDTITTNVGNSAPRNGFKVAEPIIIDDYNQRVPQDQDTIGTVTTQFGNSAPRHGYKIAEPLRIPQATEQGYVEVPPGSLFDASYPNSKTRRGRVQDGGQTSPILTAGGEAPSYYEGKTGCNYRIRKLTPRECFRLMGVCESDIDKIQQSGVSQSQQYKMAGNSIVVDVLYHIFRKLFVITGQESQQLSLF